MNDLEKKIFNYIKSVRQVLTLSAVKVVNSTTLLIVFGNDILQVTFDWNKKSVKSFALPQTLFPKKEGNMLISAFSRSSQSELFLVLSMFSDKTIVNKLQQISITK